MGTREGRPELPRGIEGGGTTRVDGSLKNTGAAVTFARGPFVSPVVGRCKTKSKKCRPTFRCLLMFSNDVVTENYPTVIRCSL